LEETPTSPWPASKAGALGFENHSCGDCHPAPLYTDSSVDHPQRHDVGTWTPASGLRKGVALDGLDTPTLLGTWATAPYLHDGSAPTLGDAIQAHTSVDATEQEITDLAAFVRSL
jgi:hypothetical protein